MSNRKLIEMISALLALDKQRALVPHGVGGHGRELLERSANALAEHDALAAQRDEGLAREAELQSEVQRLTFERQPLEGAYSAVLKQNDALQQRLTEAERLLRLFRRNLNGGGDHLRGMEHGEAFRAASAFLASPGCADGDPTK